MASIMSGEATPAQLGALLAALAVRGETTDEIAGFAKGMRAAAVAVRVADGAIDTCGTGGDRSSSFNISTVSAIAAAAAGARVAKHGNRAASSLCGSADLLEALGLKIDLGPEEVAICVDEVGLGFMFAPRFHPAMRHAGPIRREIGIRTIFNVLGPLADPAGVKRQLLGVPAAALGERIVAVLRELGAERALVVHSADGLDEITTAGTTYVAVLEDGAVRTFEITPEDAGLSRVKPEALRGGEARENAQALMAGLKGKQGPFRDVAVLNAAAGLMVAGRAKELKEAVELAQKSIDSGEAHNRLERLVTISHA